MEKDYRKAIKYGTKIIDIWLPWKIQHNRIPGLAVGVVHNGELVYQKGFGYADVELKIPVTPKTCFRIASISKTFTAIAIMRLVEQNKIALDDKVKKYLPWFKAEAKNNSLSDITLRQILSHSGGVYRDGDIPHFEGDTLPDAEELKRSISNQAVVFKNSTRFKYSNFGFALLGEVIKKTSNIDYEEYITRHIIKKLGMKRTAPDFKKKYNAWLAKGYSRPLPYKKREAFHHSETKAYAPAMGALSNVYDLAKYVSSLSLKHNGGNILISEKSKEEITRKHRATGEKGESYGLGFDVVTIKKRKIVGHYGCFAGFTAQMYIDTTNDIGVITLANTNDASVGLINTGIFEMIYEFVDKENKYKNKNKPSQQRKFEGVYRSRVEDTIVVGAGSTLVAFNANTNSPAKNWTRLRTKGQNKFLMETKSNFDASGETATFIFGKKTHHATKVVFGAVQSERLMA